MFLEFFRLEVGIKVSAGMAPLKASLLVLQMASPCAPPPWPFLIVPTPNAFLCGPDLLVRMLMSVLDYANHNHLLFEW